MPDPGAAALPPVPEGEDDYKFALEKFGQEAADQWRLRKSVEMLQTGKYTPSQIDDYFGTSPPKPTPAAATAATANVGRAVEANDGNTDFLGGPKGFLAGVGIDYDWWTQATQEEMKRQEQGLKVAGDVFTRSQGEEPWSDARALHLAEAGLGQVNAGVGWALSLLTGPFTSSVSRPLVGVINDPNNPFGGDRAGKLPDTAVTDAVAAATALGGGTHLAEAAKIPEALRSLAVDGLRSGELRDPADVLGVAGQGSAIAKAMPRTADFTAAVDQLGGSAAWTDPIGKSKLSPLGERVLGNLYQVWANTGRGPTEVAALAKDNPSIGEELVQHDPFGRAVTPQLTTTAPKPPPSPTLRPTKAALTSTTAVGRTAQVTGPAPATFFTNTVDKAMDMMRQLEHSADNAISHNAEGKLIGAVGRFQIMPATARQYGFDPARLMDPDYNTMVARTIITHLFNEFHGNMEAMAIAYNDGPGRAQRWVNEGRGTRLEAIPDKTMRSGWRYEVVAADRNEAFLPLETQQYVARARAKMNGKEADINPEGWQRPTPGDAAAEAEQGIAEGVEAAKEADARAEEEGRQAISDENVLTHGSLSAANPYETMTTDERVEESLRSIGEQPKETFWKQMQTAEGRSAWMARRLQEWDTILSPANRVDQDLIKAGALDRKTELTIADAFRNTASSDERAIHSLMVGKVSGRMVDGSVDYTGEGGTLPRLLAAIYDSDSDLDKFKTRLLSERAVNRLTLAVKKAKAAGKSARQGLEEAPAMPISPSLAHANMKDPELAKLDDAVSIWNDMREAKLQYLVDNGMLSPEGKSTLIAHDPTWMSWQALTGEPRGFGGGGFSVANPIERLEGHEGPVVDPFEGIKNDTRLAFKMADRNGARQFARGLMESDPETAVKYGWKKVGKIDVNEDVIDKALREAGVDPKDITDEMRAAVEPLVAQRLERDLPENQFLIWDNGKPTKYAVDSPDFARMFKGFATQAETSDFIRAMTAVSKFERGAQIANPAFAVRVLSEQHPLQTWLFDKSVPHHYPFEELVKGMMSYLRKDDIYQAAKVHGAFAEWADQIEHAWTTSTTTDGGPLTQDLLHTFAQDKNGIWQVQRNMARSPAEFAQWVRDSYINPAHWAQGGRDLMTALSQANRTGAFRMGVEAGQSSAKAASNARQMFLDPEERMASQFVDRYASTVNYMHMHLLGERQVLNAFRDDGSGRAGNIRDTLVKVLYGVSLPSAGLQAWSMMQDKDLPENERYINIPQYQKDSMFITPRLPWGGRFMMPYPWGVQPLMMMQQRLLEGAFQGMFGDAGSKAKWGDGQFWSDFARSFIPPILPTAIEPAVDVWANRSWSGGAPVVSDSVKARLPADRYTQGTSSFARTVGGALGQLSPDMLNPAALQYMIDSYSGAIGMSMLKAWDGTWHALTNTGRPLDMSDVPGVNWFVHTAPGFDGAQINNFYETYQDFQENRASFEFFKHEAIGEGLKTVDPHDVDMLKARSAMAMGKVAAGIAMARSIVYGAEADGKKPPSEKYAQIKAGYAYATVMAMYGNEYMRIVSDQSIPIKEKPQAAETAYQRVKPRLDALRAQLVPGSFH